MLRQQATAAEFEFKCASIFDASHPSSVRLTQMWEAIERESGGRIHTRLFPNSVLGGESATFSQVRLGALTFALVSAGTLATIVPLADISFLGFAFNDEGQGLQAMDGPLGDYVLDQTAAKGLYAFREIWNAGMGQLCLGMHPIRTPDDLHGIKVRVAQSRILFDLFKTLGATPTPIEMGEIYTALQMKLIDGVSSPLVTMETSRWYEVTKFVSLTNHSWSSIRLVMSADVWRTIPSALQGIIERNHTKYAILERRDTKLGNLSVADKLRRQGITINSVTQTPFRSGLQTYYKFWANEFGPKAWGFLETSLGRKLV